MDQFLNPEIVPKFPVLRVLLVLRAMLVLLVLPARLEFRDHKETPDL